MEIVQGVADILDLGGFPEPLQPFGRLAPEGIGIIDGRLVVAEVLLARDAGLGREFRLDRIQISHEVLPGRSCDAPILRHG